MFTLSKFKWLKLYSLYMINCQNFHYLEELVIMCIHIKCVYTYVYLISLVEHIVFMAFSQKSLLFLEVQ